MSTDTYVDPVVHAQAMADAKALEKAQTEAYTGAATERGIQCGKAHEIIDLWFALWEPPHVLRWEVISGGQRPSLAAAMALIETCMSYAPDHEDKEPAVEQAVAEEPTFGVAPHEPPPTTYEHQPTQY